MSDDSKKGDFDVVMRDSPLDEVAPFLSALKRPATLKPERDAEDRECGSDSESECPDDSDDVELVDAEQIERSSNLTTTTTFRSGPAKIFLRSVGTRKVGAIVYPADKSKYLSNEKKKRVTRKVVRIPDLGTPSKSDRAGDFACYVQGPCITFSRSDSKQSPDRKTYDTIEPPFILQDGTVNFWYKLPKQSPQVLWWKRKIGTWLAIHVLKFDDAVKGRQMYFITKFPDGYELYQQRKGPKEDPRVDCYLESKGRVRQFRSPEEFYEHAAWLIQKRPTDGERANCICLYCKARRQKLRRKAGILT